MYTDDELKGFRELHSDSPKTKYSKGWEHGWTKDSTYKDYDVSSEGADGDKWSNRAVVNRLAEYFGDSMRVHFNETRWGSDSWGGRFGNLLMGDKSGSPKYGWDFYNAKSDANGLGEVTDIFNQAQTGFVAEGALTRESMGVSTAVSENAFLQAKASVSARLNNAMGGDSRERGDALANILWIKSESFLEDYVSNTLSNSKYNYPYIAPYALDDVSPKEVKRFTKGYVDFLSNEAQGLAEEPIGRLGLTQKGGALNANPVSSSTHEALRRH